MDLAELFRQFPIQKLQIQVKSSEYFIYPVGWLAPEVMNKDEFTEAADVYSFGVILWELVARKMFFYDIAFDTGEL